MDLADHPVVNFLGLILVAYLVWRRLRAPRKYSSLCLPPGPKPLPIIGNMLDIPLEHSWLTYTAWAQQYGDVVSVSSLGRTVVILNTLEAINDLMERRGATYSDRPRTNIMALMDLTWIHSLMPYGIRWRTGRRMLHTHLHQGVVTSYRPIQRQYARTLAKDLIRDSLDLGAKVRLSIGGSVMKLCYGIDIHGTHDEYILTAEGFNEFINLAVLPGRYLVDIVGVLKYMPGWIPGAGFQREAVDCKRLGRKTRDVPIEYVKKKMAEGSASASMAQAMLADADPQDIEIQSLIGDILGTVYLAGMDTTVSTAMSFFLALVINPDVQAKGQAEIDRVVGTDRLPTFEDRLQLPYVEAIISEALRWNPVLPLGVSHTSMEDDEYKGYYIPKNSIIIPNTWNILHDPVAYPEPDHFKPERFLKVNELGEVEFDKSVRDPRAAMFGYGRRVCVGRWLADQSMYAIVSTTLAVLSVGRAKDAHGVPKAPRVEYSGGLLSHPKPFEYTIKSRSKQAEELINNACNM